MALRKFLKKTAGTAQTAGNKLQQGVSALAQFFTPQTYTTPSSTSYYQRQNQVPSNRSSRSNQNVLPGYLSGQWFFGSQSGKGPTRGLTQSQAQAMSGLPQFGYTNPSGPTVEGMFGRGNSSSIGSRNAVNPLQSILGADIAGKQRAEEANRSDRAMLLANLGMGNGGGNTQTPSISESDLYKNIEQLATQMTTGKEPYGDAYWKSMQGKQSDEIAASTRGLMRQASNRRQPGWQEAVQNILSGRQGQMTQSRRDLAIAKGESGRTERERGLGALQALLGTKSSTDLQKEGLGLNRTALLQSILGQYTNTASDFSPFYSMMAEQNPDAFMSAMASQYTKGKNREASSPGKGNRLNWGSSRIGV